MICCDLVSLSDQVAVYNNNDQKTTNQEITPDQRSRLSSEHIFCAPEK
jgi:hypothetical protein